LDFTCNAGDYWDGDNNKCETCENDSTTHEAGKVGADSCTGVDVCQNDDEYFDATSKNCTKCQGDYKSTNASLVGTQTDLCKGDVCEANSFMPTDGSGKGDKCLVCPGASTSAAGKIGFDNCDGNITAYINYGEDDLLTNINEGDQQFRDIAGVINGDFGQIYKSDGQVPDAVCRKYTSLTANCAVGYARSSDGKIDGFDLTDGQEACGGIGFDITGDRGAGPSANFEADGASATFGGNATVCVQIPTLNTNNEEDPATTLDNVVNAIEGDSIINVYITLEDIDNIRSEITDYTNSTHDDYWSLLNVAVYDVAEATATYVPINDDDWINNYQDITTETEGRANFTDDIAVYEEKLDDYNEKLVAYKGHIQAIVDNANLLKDDLDAIKTLTDDAAVTGAYDAANTTRTQLTSQRITTHEAWNELFIRNKLATYSYAELGDEHGNNQQTNTGIQQRSKNYRKTIFDLSEKITDFAEKQGEILTQGQRFGSCSNGGSVDKDQKLVVGPGVSDSCNSTTTDALTAALQGLGVAGGSNLNSTAGWSELTGSAKELKEAFEAVEEAKDTISEGYNNGWYDTKTQGNGVPALSAGQQALDPSLAAQGADTLLAALNGKNSGSIAGWA